MSNYNIYVTNASGHPQSYYLICEVPKIASSSNTSPKVYSVIYLASVPIQGDGSTYRFTFGYDIFACCGYQKLQDCTNVSTIDNTPMDLNGVEDNIANMVIDNGGPGFGVSSPDAEPGTFEVTVPDYDSTTYPEVWCGLGRLKPFDSSVPNTNEANNAVSGVRAASCWQAQPVETYQITPMSKFSLVTGEFEAGDIIDIGDNAVDVKFNFEDQGNNVYASVTQNNDGSFGAVAYSASPPDVKKPKY